jgi:hypothetical protein
MEAVRRRNAWAAEASERGLWARELWNLTPETRDPYVWCSVHKFCSSSGAAQPPPATLCANRPAEGIPYGNTNGNNLAGFDSEADKRATPPEWAFPFQLPGIPGAGTRPHMDPRSQHSCVPSAPAFSVTARNLGPVGPRNALERKKPWKFEGPNCANEGVLFVGNGGRSFGRTRGGLAWPDPHSARRPKESAVVRGGRYSWRRHTGQ